MSIVTSNGTDRYCVASVTEAMGILDELYERTSLSKKELTNIVSFSGLSLSDNVRCFNHFMRDGKEGSNVKIFNRAA